MGIVFLGQSEQPPQLVTGDRRQPEGLAEHNFAVHLADRCIAIDEQCQTAVVRGGGFQRAVGKAFRQGIHEGVFVTGMNFQHLAEFFVKAPGPCICSML
ncbi:hypothetical protein [Yokenella regensburgei]